MYERDLSLETKNDRAKYIGKTFVSRGRSGLYSVLGVYDKKGTNKRYIIQFLETGHEQLTYRGSLIDYSVEDRSLENDHIGRIYTSKNCGDLKIVGYLGDSKYRCRFLTTGTIKRGDLRNIKKGEIEDPFYPRIYGVGYIGNLSPKPYKNIYTIWIKLLERLYSERHTEVFPNYVDVTMDKRWHCFEHFVKDFKQLPGYKEMEKYPHFKFNMDKDIKTNKRYYSKDTCILIPHEINQLAITDICTNKTGYPGVSVDPRKSGGYVVGYSSNGKRIALGRTTNAYEGYLWYRQAKLEKVNDLLNNKYSNFNEELKRIILIGMKRILNKHLKEE